ncbi:recombinase family protein [Alicyclobacillus ferrooxydans]|uniref:recombinase family protein n=1 Tax=Alicyclobacillus ferrooxydans TaxID=471514 RepID=UPI0009FA33B7|nr:recombinase family protein [Alicyclobacillus ferrooxydans]
MNGVGNVLQGKTLRAVAYPRYSSANQREESITAQLRAIEEYCRRKGYVLVDSYPDDARTATNDNRPNFQRMISDSDKNLFDVIIVHKLDRFARDRYDSAYYKRILKKNGVRLESVLEQLDNSPESIILESVLEGMAEYYSRNLARETRKGLLENATSGRHTGGRPPYGYKVNPETLMLEIDERTAPAVRFYFESIAKGLTLSRIIDELNSQGFRTYNGRRFTKNSFWDWARNKKYKGVYTWDVTDQKIGGGKRNSHKRKDEAEQIQIAGAVPAIVSEELWDKVNQAMKARKHKPGQFKARLTYLLSDRVKCGTPGCKGMFRGSSYMRSGSRFAYYKCSENCGSRGIRKEEFEDAIMKKLVNTVFSDEALRKITDRVQELYQEQREESQDNLLPLKTELAELDRKMNNWIEAIGEGLLDKNILAEKIREATLRKTVLQSELNRAELMQKESTIDSEAVLGVMHAKKNLLFSTDEEEKKQVIREFVESVTLIDNQESDRFDIALTFRFLTGVEKGT